MRSMPLPKTDRSEMGRQPLYERGSLPGFERATTVARLKALGKTPRVRIAEHIAIAKGATSFQMYLRKESGTPSGPGVFEDKGYYVSIQIVFLRLFRFRFKPYGSVTIFSLN
jgi:hypothetical protein